MDAAKRAATHRALDSWTVDSSAECQAGDTFGTEVDFFTQQAHFYINGACFQTLKLMDLPKGAWLVPTVTLGPGGQALINMGHRPFITQSASLVHGTLEAIEIRPKWRVVLPDDIEFLAAYMEPSADSRGCPGLSNGHIIEELDRNKEGWILCESGWVRSECLQPASLFAKRGISNIKSQQKMTHRGISNIKSQQKMKKAVSEDGGKIPSFTVLTGGEISDDNMVRLSGASSDGLAIGAEFPQNQADLTFAVTSVSDPDEWDVTSLAFIGLAKSTMIFTELSEDDSETQSRHWGTFPTAWQMHNFICLISCNGEVFGENGRAIGSVFPWRSGDAVRFAIRDGIVKCSLNGASFQKTGATVLDTGSLFPVAGTFRGSQLHVSASFDHGNSMSTFADTATRRPHVSAGFWHVLTMTCDIAKTSLELWLDGERHATFELPGGQAMALEPALGLGIFGPRVGPGSRTSELLGGQVRSLELSTSPLGPAEVWQAHAAKGVWRCREFACGRSSGAPPRRNAAEAVECVACGAARIRSQPRPPGDMDPKLEHILIVTADSFDELVLQSEQPVFLLVHTDWCGACHAVWPIWMQLAKILAGLPLRIAVIDASENDLPPKFFPEAYVPVLKLFPKLPDRECCIPVPFTGNPNDFGSFLTFLAQHTGISPETVCASSFAKYRETHHIDDLIQRIVRAAAFWRFTFDDDDDPRRSLCRFLYARLLEDEDEIASETNLGPLQIDVSLDDVSAAVDGFITPLQAQLAMTPNGMSISPGNQMNLVTEVVAAMELALAKAQPENPFVFVRDVVLLALSSPSSNRARLPRSPLSRRLVSWLFVGVFVARIKRRRSATYRMNFASTAGLRRRAAMLSEALHRHDGSPLLEVLLVQGYPAEGLPHDSATPLWLACQSGDLRAVRLLLACGADPHRIIAGTLPIEAAAEGDHHQVVRCLLQKGSVQGAALHHAAWAGNSTTLVKLLQMGCPATTHIHGCSPLALAAIRGDALCIRLLIEANCDLAMPLTSKLCHSIGLPGGSTPMHVMAVLGHEEACIDCLARPEARTLLSFENDAGQIPADVALHQLRPFLQPSSALMWDHLAQRPIGNPTQSVCQTITSAISGKIDLDSQNCHGWTALTVACASGDISAIQALLHAGANPAMGAGYVWARLLGHPAAAACLLSNGHVETSEERAAWGRLHAARVAPSGTSSNCNKRERSLSDISKTNSERGGPSAELTERCSKAWLPWSPSPTVIQEGFRQHSQRGYSAALQALRTCMHAAVCDHALSAASGIMASATVGPGEQDTVETALLTFDIGRQEIAEASLRTLKVIMDGCKLPAEAAFMVAAGLEPSVLHKVCEAPRSVLAEKLGLALRDLPAMCPSGPLFVGIAITPGTSIGDFLRGGPVPQPGAQGIFMGDQKNRYEPGRLVQWPAPTLLVKEPRIAAAAMRSKEEEEAPAAAIGRDEDIFPKNHGPGVLFMLRRYRSARDVSAFSPRGLLSEFLLPPASLRVVAIRRLTEGDLAPAELRPPWLSSPQTLSCCTTSSLEEASKLPEVLVVLDEEDNRSLEGGQISDMAP